MSPCNNFAPDGITSAPDHPCGECGWSRSAHPLALHADDVADVLKVPMPQVSLGYEIPVQPRNAADVLQGMADTFRERNAVYSDNYKMIAPMVRALFPNGVPTKLIETDHWHLFELILVKLARFASTNLAHIDSIHDTAIYAAMIEAILAEQVKCERKG